MSWWWAMIAMVSVGPVTDADLVPHQLGNFQTQAACEIAGKAYTDKATQIAKSSRKNIEVRADYICVQLGEDSKN